MVVLIRGERTAHQTALVSMGRPLLTHNNISNHSAFLRRLNNASNHTRAVARAADKLADFIRGRFIIHGQEPSRNLVKQMVNHIIYLREQNQLRFMRGHMELLARHQEIRNRLNRDCARIRNNIARRDPEFQELLDKIRNNPTNDSLIAQRNARLNQNERIRAIQRHRERLRENLIQNSTRTSEHARQLAAWKWVKEHVVHRV